VDSSVPPNSRSNAGARSCVNASTCGWLTIAKAEAEVIKDQLARFLRDELALELNPDKTLITHARTTAARYLGYEIIIQHCNHKLTNGRRQLNGVVALRVPLDVIKAKCAPYQYQGKPWHRSALQNLDDFDIIRTYGAEYRGIVGYYLLAHRRVAAQRTRVVRQDVDAEDPGCQVPVHRVKDGHQIHDQN
jgi:hypothetical protein